MTVFLCRWEWGRWRP